MKHIATNGSTIVLLDDDAARRNIRAMVLMTHGYDVQCAATVVEAQTICRETRPSVVLVGTGNDCRSHSWLRQLAVSSRPRVGFLLNEGEHLCAVLFNGKTILAREGPDDIVARVAGLLSDRKAGFSDSRAAGGTT